MSGADPPKFNRRVNVPGEMFPFVRDEKARRWAMVLLASVVVASFVFGPIGAVVSFLAAAPILKRLERRRAPEGNEPTDAPDTPMP